MFLAVLGYEFRVSDAVLLPDSSLGGGFGQTGFKEKGRAEREYSVPSPAW